MKSLYPFSWHKLSDLNYLFFAGYKHNTSIIRHSNVSNSLLSLTEFIDTTLVTIFLTYMFYTSLLFDNKNRVYAMLFFLIFKQRWGTLYISFIHKRNDSSIRYVLNKGTCKVNIFIFRYASLFKYMLMNIFLYFVKQKYRKMLLSNLFINFTEPLFRT